MQEKINKQLLHSFNERVKWIMSTDFSLPETPEAKQARIARAQKDYAYFVRTYFPHLANKPCGKFHIEAAKYLLKTSDTRAVFEWARGHAKSSHLGLLIPLWLKIQAKREINVMVLVSKSQDAAIRLLADLQAELEYNEAYKKDFGEQVKVGSWADGEFRTTDGCMFVALGRGQSPRGLKDRAKRPDYIVMDDNVIKKAKIVQDIVAEWYQPERQDRCKLWIYRHKVNPIYPMSQRTFFAYLAIDTSEIMPKIEDKRQLSLF